MSLELPLLTLDPVRLIMALLLLLLCVLAWLIIEPMLLRMGMKLPPSCTRSSLERSTLRLLVMIETVVLICLMLWLEEWYLGRSQFIQWVSGLFGSYGVFLALQTFLRLRRFKKTERWYLERVQNQDL